MEAHRHRETFTEVVEEEEEEEEEEEDEGDQQLKDDDDNGDAGDEEDALMIKRRISSHPLCEKLVKIHLECLKVGVVGEAGNDYDHLVRNRQQIMDHNKSSQRVLHQSDLNHFMEAYCVALSKLREAMEEPQQESMAFIRSMHTLSFRI